MPKVILTSEGLKNSLKHYDIKDAVVISILVALASKPFQTYSTTASLIS